MSIDLSDTRRESSESDPFPPGFAYSAEASEDHNPRIQGPMSKTLADGVPDFIHQSRVKYLSLIPPAILAGGFLLYLHNNIKQGLLNRLIIISTAIMFILAKVER